MRLSTVFCAFTITDATAGLDKREPSNPHSTNAHLNHRDLPIPIGLCTTAHIPATPTCLPTLHPNLLKPTSALCLESNVT